MLLVLSAALLLQVQVRVTRTPGASDSAKKTQSDSAKKTEQSKKGVNVSIGVNLSGTKVTAAGDTIVTDTVINGTDTSITTRRKRVRRPRTVAPELLATAFGDARARSLLLSAREARMRQDSTLRSYDVVSYQRLSVGMGFKKIGRERLMMRKEGVSRVRWQRGVGAWIDVKGSRMAFPMISGMMDEKDRKEMNDEMSEMDTDMAPIPYYPGRDALWVGGGGVARAEVNEEEIVHPLAAGAEGFYKYAIGDSASIKIAGREPIRLRELRVQARTPKWNLIVGSFWFDEDSGLLVRAVYRMSVPIDVWAVVKEHEPDAQDDIPKWVKPMISPMRAQVSAIT